jgi:hypothetical protein
MATTTGVALLVGVFEEGYSAREALATLREIGFVQHQLGYAIRCGELTQADGALDGVDAPEHDLTGGLIGLGVPVLEARALQLEFERGRAVVTVQPQRLVEAAALALGLAGAVSVLTWARRVVA